MVKKNACVFISGQGSNLKNLIQRSRDVNFPINIKLIISDNKKAFGIIHAKKNSIPYTILNTKLRNYENNIFQILQRNKKKAIDTLTIVNTIFLPLALITGYFGMNFKSMGAPSNKTGIFTLKYGQGFVLSLFVSLTLFVLFMFYHDILPQ